MRRIVAVWAVLVMACAGAGFAQAKEPCATAGENNAWLGIETIRLWPGDAPQAKGSACEDIPTLTIVRPQHGAWQRVGGGCVAGRRICAPGGES